MCVCTNAAETCSVYIVCEFASSYISCRINNVSLYNFASVSTNTDIICAHSCVNDKTDNVFFYNSRYIS